MGYILHACTVTGYPSLMDAKLGGKYLAERTEADVKLAEFRESLPENWRRLVVGPVESITNGYAWLAFMPDGSKEGWQDSDLGDEYRTQFVELFGADFTVRWGDDEPWLADGTYPQRRRDGRA